MRAYLQKATAMRPNTIIVLFQCDAKPQNYGVVARGKLASGPKVLAAVPRRAYHKLYEKEDELETGGEAVVNKD